MKHYLFKLCPTEGHSDCFQFFSRTKFYKRPRGDSCFFFLNYLLNRTSYSCKVKLNVKNRKGGHVWRRGQPSWLFPLSGGPAGSAEQAPRDCRGPRLPLRTRTGEGGGRERGSSGADATQGCARSNKKRRRVLSYLALPLAPPPTRPKVLIGQASSAPSVLETQG